MLPTSKITLPLVGGITCFILEIVFVLCNVSFFSFPLFILGFFIISYVPGRLIIKWLKLEGNHLEILTLELGTGYVATTLLYFICRSLRIEIIYFLLIFAAISYYLYSLFTNESPWPEFEIKSEIFSLLFFIVFALVIASCGYLNFSGWVFNPDGTMTIGMLVDRDIAFHVSLLEELSINFPPRYPYAGNYELAYHFFPDLFASIFVRWLNLPPADLVVRFLPVFYFTLLFLGVFTLVRKLDKNRWQAITAVFAVIFMGNLGFVFKLMGQTLQYRFEEYFAHSFTILNINPLLIALTLIILGFLSLASYQENGQKIWLVLAGCFLGLTANYKVFAALQVIAGITLAALVIWWRKKDKSLLFLSLLSGVIAGVSILLIWLKSPYHGTFIRFKPWFLVHFTKVMRLSAAEQFSFTYEKFQRLMFGEGIVSFLYYFVGLGLFYLFGCLWLRVIGLKKWGRDLLGRDEKLTEPVIAYTILVGIIFAMLFTRPPEEFNVIFSLELSLYLMSLYAVAALFRLIEKGKIVTKIVIVSLFLLLSVPTTLNLLIDKPEHLTVHPQFVNLGKFIKNNVPPGSLIAHSFQAPLYIILAPLGGVRSMAELVFPIENLLGKETMLKLRRDNLNIYKTTDLNKLKSIIIRHKLDYVVEDQHSRIRVPKNQIMKEIYHQDGYIVNKVIKPNDP